jgi:serine/threonine-protein kinase
MPEEVMDRNANAAPTVDDCAEASCAPLAPGTCVAGKYIICDVLGTGGSAVVYAAEQVSLKRVVAFKLYPATGELALALLKRFEREAQLLARVHHENVVAVFDAGSMPDGSPYLVVQRLQGESLATRLLAGPLPIAETVQLARQLLSALSALGDTGITHRDIKPGNIVFDRLAEGRTVPKLVDFGIAKESTDEASRVLDEMVGTPRYMAPEQVRGEPLDARCDLYALGVTLYEMLTGRTPHTGDSIHEIVRATLFAPITPVSALRLDCPEGLSQIVMRALARDAGDRFASAREMLRALDAWQVQQGPSMAAPALGVQGLPSARPADRVPSIPAPQRRASPASRRDPRAAERPPELVDTLRLGNQSTASQRVRGKRNMRRIAAITCLAAVGCLVLANEFDVRSRAQTTPTPMSRHGALARPDLLRALRARASETSAQLMTHVRSSAQELLESVRGGQASGERSEATRPR